MMLNRFGEVSMGAAIALREDFDAADLRRFAKGSQDAAQSRRLLARWEEHTSELQSRRNLVCRPLL